MKHPVLPDEIFVDIGKDRIRQAQLGRYLLTIGWGICTHCDHLRTEAFNLLIIFLQLISRCLMVKNFELPNRQIPKRKISDTNPDQFENGMADGVTHAPDLTILPFSYG